MRFCITATDKQESEDSRSAKKYFCAVLLVVCFVQRQSCEQTPKLLANRLSKPWSLNPSSLFPSFEIQLSTNKIQFQYRLGLFFGGGAPCPLRLGGYEGVHHTPSVIWFRAYSSTTLCMAFVSTEIRTPALVVRSESSHHGATPQLAPG